jgi:hypothetical protein
VWVTHEILASNETRGASADSGNPRNCVATITPMAFVTKVECHKAETGGLREARACFRKFFFDSPSAMTSLSKSGCTAASADQRLILLSEKSAGPSVDQMQPGAGLACNGLILGFRRVLIVVQPVLNFQPGRRAAEKSMGHAPRTRRCEMLGPQAARRHFVPETKEVV